MPNRFIVEPAFDQDVVVGGAGAGPSRLLLGRLAENGPNRNVYLDITREFVAIILGKRGSGKSYSLGSLIEGLAASPNVSSIASFPTSCQRPAILLLDPLMTFWTTAIAAAPTGTPKVQEAYAALESWGIEPATISTSLWIPAGFRKTTDFAAIQELRVRASDLDASDWADLCGVNLIREPQGILLGEAHSNVLFEGYDGPHGRVPANPLYSVSDLVAYLDAIAEIGRHDHDRSTLRALRRTLQGYARLPLFSGAGTALTQVLSPGTVSILLLPPRVGHDLRRVITRILIRRILREREVACHIQHRTRLEVLSDQDQITLQNELAAMVPKTILAIDEAQELLGDDGGEARTALEDYCLQGRNYGLSLILATQRPTTSAISPKVRSQADTYLVHQLLTDDDIMLVQKNLLAAMPEEVRDGDRVLQFSAMIRALARGQCFVTGSNVRSGTTAATGRSFLMNTRPRMCIHGGELD